MGIQWEIPKVMSEARAPVKQRRTKDLPNPTSGNGSFQFHVRLTMSKSSVCEKKKKCRDGAHWELGKGYEGNQANWQCFRIEWIWLFYRTGGRPVIRVE